LVIETRFVESRTGGLLMAEDKNITVLVADDEDDFRRIMTFWLGSKGYTVIAAPDGKTAVELVKTKNPDIVFLDLKMPGMDGNETFKKIREFNQDIPVIIISAHINMLTAREIISSGVSGVFFKDEDFEKGLLLLESVLRTHKKLRK